MNPKSKKTEQAEPQKAPATTFTGCSFVSTEQGRSDLPKLIEVHEKFLQVVSEMVREPRVASLVIKPGGEVNIGNCVHVRGQSQES